jgi:hypothetical protein
MSPKSSAKMPSVIATDGTDDALGVDSRLVIHRGYVNGPFSSGSFTIDVGHPFSGHLVQVIPIPKAGKSCVVQKVSSALTTVPNQLSVTYSIQSENDLAQIAYALFVTS